MYRGDIVELGAILLAVLFGAIVKTALRYQVVDNKSKKITADGEGEQKDHGPTL